MTKLTAFSDMPTLADPSATVGGSRTEGMEADLTSVLDALRRNRWLILTIVCLSLCLGIIVIARSEMLYRASATIQIEAQSQKILSTDENHPDGGSQEADRFLQTQLSLLKSRALTELVVDQLNLANRIQATGRSGEPLSFEQRKELAITKLQSEMTVTLPRDSSVAEITIVDGDPNFTAAAANAFAEMFINYNLRRRFGETDYARQFLEGELAKAKKRLEASEKAVVEYARQSRLVDASGSTSGGDGIRMLTASSMTDVNTALTQAQIVRIGAERRWQEAEHTPPLDLPEVLANPVIQQLLQERARTLADYNKDRQIFKPDFPATKDKLSEISTLENEAQKIGEQVRNGLRNNYLIAVQQEKALTDKLEGLKSLTLTEQNKGIEYNILRREVDTNRLMYDGLLQRFKEVSASAGVTANNISIVDHAQVPSRPFTPRVTLTLASSLGTGLLLAFFIVAMRAKLDDILRSPVDVIERLGIPLLATIPLRPRGISALEMIEGSVLSEAFWSLHIALDRTVPKVPPRSVAFTSSRASQSKSMCAYAAALNFARSGKRVLLIDADLRRPSLHRLLDLPNEYGLAGVLTQQCTLKDAVRSTTFRGLSVMTAGQPTRNPAELFAEPALPALLKSLQQGYDMVVVDSPAVLLLSDAVVVATNTASSVFVIEANRTRAEDARSAIHRLQENGAKMAGSILTEYNQVLSLYKPSGP